MRRLTEEEKKRREYKKRLDFLAKEAMKVRKEMASIGKALIEHIKPTDDEVESAYMNITDYSTKEHLAELGDMWLAFTVLDMRDMAEEDE